jgi:hypothetical protein
MKGDKCKVRGIIEVGSFVNLCALWTLWALQIPWGDKVIVARAMWYVASTAGCDGWAG